MAKKKKTKKKKDSKAKKSTKSKGKSKKKSTKKKSKKSKTKKKSKKKKKTKSKSKKKESEDKMEEEKKVKSEDLKKKAEALAKKIESEDIKGKLEKEAGITLMPLKEYLKSGVYIGTKVITPHMKEFIYKRRNDGIATMNTKKIDEKIKEAISKISKYDPDEFIVVCKREAGWKAVEKFSQLTGVKVFTKKYPAGILTNPELPRFFETEMVFVCDPWIDKNAMNDAKIVKKDVFALCDTNNYTFKVDFFIPCNNKSNKSLGLIFYLLAKGYLEKKGIQKEFSREDFL